MGALLKIESDEAVAMATRLAELTGQTVDQAVQRALREQVALAEARREKSDRIMAIAAEIRAHLRPPLPSSDHQELYDEDGFPA